MNFASSVAVAVALGTPGIGNVNTGLLPSHATDVLPTVMTSAGSRCGLGVIGGGSEVPANAALNAPCGLAHRRIIRSSTVAGIGVALAVGPSAGDLDPLTRRLVADAGSILRHIAGLPVHLHGALALIFERHDQIAFLTAPQHARVPGPVEEDCLQVLRTCCRSVRRRAASTSAAASLSTSGICTLATL